MWNNGGFLVFVSDTIFIVVPAIFFSVDKIPYHLICYIFKSFFLYQCSLLFCDRKGFWKILIGIVW